VTLEYPAIVEHGERRIRRWTLLLSSPGPIEQDLEQLGLVCQTSIEMLRRSAHVGLARDFSVFAATVKVRRHTPTELEVEVEYSPHGAIGDCVLTALWIPIQIIDAIWRVERLQGAERARWRPFLSRH